MIYLAQFSWRHWSSFAFYFLTCHGYRLMNSSISSCFNRSDYYTIYYWYCHLFLFRKVSAIGLTCRDVCPATESSSSSSSPSSLHKHLHSLLLVDSCWASPSIVPTTSLGSSSVPFSWNHIILLKHFKLNTYMLIEAYSLSISTFCLRALLLLFCSLSESISTS